MTGIDDFVAEHDGTIRRVLLPIYFGLEILADEECPDCAKPLAKRIGLRAARRMPLWNGALECRLFEFRIVAGSARKPRPAPGVT